MLFCTAQDLEYVLLEARNEVLTDVSVEGSEFN